MKNCPFTYLAILLSFFIWSCQGDVKDQESTKYGLLTTDSTDVKISFKEADKRIKKYNYIYGKGRRYLTGDSDSVLLPRYFTINSDSFFKLLTDKSRIEFPLFASLDVKERKYKDSTFKVANLIFHNIRPKPDGSLNNFSNDTFIDYGNACPVDCEKPGGDPEIGGGFDGEKVSKSEAKQRIEDYNKIYGLEDRYIKAPKGKDSLLIARYFDFSKDDIRELLAKMKGKHEFFYVSMGANPKEGNMDQTYVSDLIFHFKRPNKDGHLDQTVERSLSDGDDDDDYYDVTTPCPNACDN